MKTVDILVCMSLALIFGILFQVTTIAYAALKFSGFHLEQSIYGIWLIGATLPYFLIRKPGVALFTEIAASAGSLFMGSEWGLITLLYGFAQGLLAESLYLLLKYKSFSITTCVFGAIAACCGSVIMDIFYGDILSLAHWNLALFIGIRFSSAIIIAGIFSYRLVRILEKNGVAEWLRPIEKM